MKVVRAVTLVRQHNCRYDLTLGMQEQFVIQAVLSDNQRVIALNNFLKMDESTFLTNVQECKAGPAQIEK